MIPHNPHRPFVLHYKTYKPAGELEFRYEHPAKKLIPKTKSLEALANRVFEKVPVEN
jgi:hypothetical protein